MTDETDITETASGRFRVVARELEPFSPGYEFSVGRPEDGVIQIATPPEPASKPKRARKTRAA